jgi:hypothetical protein
MSSRDEILAYLGLPLTATFSEIEHAYLVRTNSVQERLAAGDESARVELAVLEEAFGRLTGRGPGRREGKVGVDAAVGLAATLEEPHLRPPSWWECYLALIVALASVAALVALIAFLPHVYRDGGFRIPLALILSSALLSIVGTMLCDAQLQEGRRINILRNRGIDSGGRSVLRFHVARIASVLSRYVRWLIGPALIVTLFLNFASLTRH